MLVLSQLFLKATGLRRGTLQWLVTQPGRVSVTPGGQHSMEWQGAGSGGAVSLKWGFLPLQTGCTPRFMAADQDENMLYHTGGEGARHRRGSDGGCTRLAEQTAVEFSYVTMMRQGWLSTVFLVPRNERCQLLTLLS